MPNFLSKIISNKKNLFFILPILLALGIIIPASVHAGWIGCGVGVAVASMLGLFTMVFSLGLSAPVALGGVTAVAAIACATGSLAGSGLTADGQTWVKSIVMGVGNVILGISSSLASTVVAWFSTFLTIPMMTKPILSQPAFQAGWLQVRDFSNMFIVLGFVIVGIATALRLRDYEAKKLLWPLILVALLVNFSGLFCGLIIDGSNILTTHFLKAGGNSGTSIMAVFEIQKQAIPWDTMLQNGDLAGYMQNIGYLTFCNILVFIVYFYLTIVLVARQAIFGILFVLSPLAFVCLVFPATKKMWTMWSEHFIKWGLLGAQIAFFVWVAGTMMTTTSQMNVTEILAVLVLLFAAVSVARKSSGPAGTAVLGLATGGAGFAMGALSKGGGAIMEKMGRTKGGQALRERISGGMNRIAESTGFAPVGHAAQQKSARAAEAKKQVDALQTSANGGDKARFSQLVQSGKGPLGAAAVASANESGKLHEHFLNSAGVLDADGLKKMNGRVATAQAFGYQKGDFLKKNYELAGHDTERVAAVRKATGGTEAEAREKVIKEQLKTNLPQMSTAELGRINPDHVEGPTDGFEFVKNNFTPRMVDQMQVSSNPDLIAAMKDHSNSFKVERAKNQTRDASGKVTINNQTEWNKMNNMAKAADKLKI